MAVPCPSTAPHTPQERQSLHSFTPQTATALHVAVAVAAGPSQLQETRLLFPCFLLVLQETPELCTFLGTGGPAAARAGI